MKKRGYKVGDKVWLYVKTRTDRCRDVHRKLKFPWQGPYIVTKVMSMNVVHIRLESGSE